MLRESFKMFATRVHDNYDRVVCGSMRTLLIVVRKNHKT